MSRRTPCRGCTMVEDDDGSTFPMYVSGCETHDPTGERHLSATIHCWYVDGEREQPGSPYQHTNKQEEGR